MALTRIHHIGIAVEDADEAGKLWQDVFGLEVALDMELEAHGVRGVIFPLDNCEIELLQPTRPDTGIAKYIETNGAGFHHICFESTDVAADLLAAAASGMEMIDTEPRQGLTGMIGFIHPRENHGVLVEFAQPPADAPRYMGPSGDASPHALHHMTVAVHDVDGVRDELAAKYGMAATRRGSSEALGIDAQFMHLGGTDIELVTGLPGAAEGPLQRQLQRGEGMFMAALTVRDPAAAVAMLREHGITVTDAEQGGFISPRNTYRTRLRLSGA